MIGIALICSICLSTVAASIPIVSQSVAVQQSVVSSAEIPKGRLIETVICADEPTQSYALYLPSNYSDERKWPVLFAFDPGARGKVPVERYRDAAQKFGWLVIGSNNSRNGPMQPSINAWNAVVRDAQKRFRIDERRVYATGFSGAARLAIYLAAQCQGCISGVIASAAGFPVGLNAAAPSAFPIFATAGLDDFNFAEVMELDQNLTKAQTTHRAEVFEGRHDWPPSTVASDAIEWMEFQAMKAGTRQKDGQLIESSWQAQSARARSLIDTQRYYDAFLAYSAIAATFKGLRDVTDAQNALSKLQSNPGVKNAIRDEQRQISRQREIEARIRRLLAASQRVTLKDDSENAIDNSRPIDNGSGEAAPETQLKSLFSDLRKQSAKPDDGGDRRIARRVLEGTTINLFEQGTSELQQKHYNAAVRLFSLATEVNPDRPGAFFYLASAYAANGDKKASLRSLRNAVDRGFSDAGAVIENRLFDSIRDEAEYREIIGTLKLKQ